MPFESVPYERMEQPYDCIGAGHELAQHPAHPGATAGRQAPTQHERPVLRAMSLASLILIAITWLDWWFTRSDLLGLPYPVWICALLAANLALTAASPRHKRGVVRWVQARLVNPIVRALLRRGLSVGWCLLETTGRRTGLPRAIPVGNGRQGDTFWVIAEHGRDAAYVKNIRADPRVRVLVRRSGWRMTWEQGHAAVLDHDDPYARQRALIGWRHPLRALNALMVRILGTEPVTVRIDLATPAGR